MELKCDIFMVYAYDELPTEEAKEAARDWWRGCEAVDPSWAGEFRDSLKAGLDAVCDGMDLAPFKDCSATGVFCDWFVYEAIRDYGGPWDHGMVRQAIRDAFDAAWDCEHDAIMEQENVEENIRVNEYTFRADGSIY